MSDSHEKEKQNLVEDTNYATSSNASNTSNHSHKKEIAERGGWDSKLEYILSSIGYAVGLGNVWRFPYLCFKNGGGAFLLPYLIVLVLCGLPIYLLENSIGQFSSYGPVRAFNGMPIFKGIGFSMVAVSFFVAPYYNIILSWVLYYVYETVPYLWNSEQKLPWQECKPEYGSRCYDRQKAADCQAHQDAIFQICPAFEKCFNEKSHQCYINSMGRFMEDTFPEEFKPCRNLSSIVGNETKSFKDQFYYMENNCSEYNLRQTAPEFFYETQVLGLPQRPAFNPEGGIIENITDLGPLQWHLLLTLLVSWTIVGFSIIKGVKSTGKTMYVTATFPYIVLTILLANAVFKDGAIEGIKFFLTPVPAKLLEPSVWKDAVTQIFYSLSVSWGGLLTLSSYNPFRNNLIKDTYIVVCANSATSIYAGLAIFGYLGIMSHSLHMNIEDIVAGGPGFAFIVWPEAMTLLSKNMHLCAFFALLFFLMLYSLGLSTMVVTVETVATSILDIFPNMRGQRLKLVVSLIALQFCIGIPLVCSRGLYWFQVFDDYSASYSLVFSAITEMLAMSHVYGLDRISSDLMMMCDGGLNKFFRITWSYVTPIILIVTLFFNVLKHKGSNFKYYGIDYFCGPSTYPLAFLLVFTPISLIIGFGIREVLIKRSKGKTFSDACKPTRHWGPYSDEDRKEFNGMRRDGLRYRCVDEIEGEELKDVCNKIKA